MQGNELRGIRKKIGYTQEQLAGAIGMTATSIGLMERGAAPIESRTAWAVMQIGFREIGEAEMNKHFRQEFVAKEVGGHHIVVDRQLWEQAKPDALLSLMGSSRLVAGPFEDRATAEAEAQRLNDA